MKKQIVILSISSLVLIIASIIFLGMTFGWFIALTSIPDHDISVGDLRYTESGAFITDTTILPGMELVDSSFTLDNESTIDSQLRIKIEYTKVTYDGTIHSSTVAYTGATDDHIFVSMDVNLTNEGDYFYYGGSSNVLSPNSGLMTLVTSIYYDGSFASIDYSDQPITITITIEGKQSDNVTWTELIGYDFSTGYPAP